MATKTITRYRTRTVRTRRHSKAGFRVPLAVVAGFVPLGVFAYTKFRAHPAAEAAQLVGARLTGYFPSNNTWSFNEL